MNPEKRDMLYTIICCSFCVIVTTSNIISAKMVALPFLPDFAVPAGLITYPLTIFLSDMVTEIFGAKKARMMVYITLGVNLLCFGIIRLSLMLPGLESNNTEAYTMILGLSGLRIFSSLTAYFVSQITAIQVYDMIRQRSGLQFVWLRNNGSNCAAQLADTLTIDLIYLFWGLGMPLEQVAPVMLFSYLYKMMFGALLTPLFCMTVSLIKERWSYNSTLQSLN